jgi:hypothetical protein
MNFDGRSDMMNFGVSIPKTGKRRHFCAAANILLTVESGIDDFRW